MTYSNDFFVLTIFFLHKSADLSSLTGKKISSYFDFKWKEINSYEIIERKNAKKIFFIEFQFLHTAIRYLQSEFNANRIFILKMKFLSVSNNR